MKQNRNSIIWGIATANQSSFHYAILEIEILLFGPWGKKFSDPIEM